MKRIILLLSVILLSIAPLPAHNPPRIALVLSGGGALGYAHIGVLQALDEAGIRPSIIAGTSMGAIVGSIYAQGYTGDQLFQFAQERRLHNISRNVNVSLRQVNKGVGAYKNVRKLLNDAIPHDSFDSLAIPFVCVSTNVRTGSPEVRSSGCNLADWVLASASIPVVFKPQQIEGEYYCDGGFVDNLPARYLPRESYDICIGIDVVPTTTPTTDDYFSFGYTISDVYSNMIMDINSKEGRQHCRYLIRPHTDVRYGILDFRHYKTLRQRGYDCMKAWLQSHPELLPDPQSGQEK